MEESIDQRPSKRLKTIDEQNRYSTFESLSGELILGLFEYFNTKEILMTFFNLTPLINSCIVDRRQEFHVYLDRSMYFLDNSYYPDQVISLHIENVTIQIDIFPNLKSLCIVCDNTHEHECLNMIQQIAKLSQLINLTLSFVGPRLTLIGHKMIEISLRHSSLRRIILSKSKKPRSHSSYKAPPVKLIFPTVKLIYVSDAFHGEKICQLYYKKYFRQQERIEPQYHVRCLNLDFNNWRVRTLIHLLSSLPLLVELRIKGCAQVGNWLWFHIWDRIFQKLKALQRVVLDIYVCHPIAAKQEKIKKFNNKVSQAIQTCKRINLTLGIRNIQPGLGCFQLSASLNMN